MTRPRAQNWHSFRLGTSGSHLSAEINNRDKIIRARVNIPNDLTLYEGLKHNRREIEKEFGETLDWQDLDGCKASKIIIYKDNCHLNKEDQWEIYSNWFIENLEKFYQIFSPKIKQLKNGEHQLRIN